MHHALQTWLTRPTCNCSDLASISEEASPVSCMAASSHNKPAASCANPDSNWSSSACKVGSVILLGSVKKAGLLRLESAIASRSHVVLHAKFIQTALHVSYLTRYRLSCLSRQARRCPTGASTVTRTCIGRSIWSRYSMRP